MSLRAVRQLRRVRAFYTVGVLLWAASTAWTSRQSPGSRQMWVSVLLLAIFAGLLAAATFWLRRFRTARTARPTHHAASRRTGGPRRAHA